MNFLQDSALAQKDLKGLPPKSCSQLIALNHSSLILKVIGVEVPVIAHSPFQVSYRGNDGNLVTKLVAFIGNLKEEAQAFVLDEEVIFRELKGVKLRKIDDDLINCNSAEDFNKIKKDGNRVVTTSRNC